MATAKDNKRILKSLGKVEMVAMMLRVDELTPSRFNPSIRTETGSLKDLTDSMEKDDFWPWMPLIVSLDGTIIDGHRRHEVAKRLGKSLVPCVVVDGDPDELWAKINGTRMQLSGKQVTEAMSLGLKTAPARWRPLTDRLKQVIGEDGLDKLGQRKVSPFVIHQATRIAKYCDLGEDDDFIGMAVWWLVNHAMMSTVSRNAMKSAIDVNTLESAIRGDRVLRADYRTN